MATTTRQRLAGGVLIGVAALAFYIGTQFKGPGLGGSGSGDGGPNPGQATNPSTSTTPTTDLVGDEAIQATTVATPPTPSSPLVAVVISGNKYLLSTTGDETRATPSELAEVVRSVLSASGDGQGIRVRVYRKKDATTGAQFDLSTKLGDAGVPSEEIQVMQTFLDQ
jgi:hypothetical protein